jgi:D-alanine-D-alanine ligase
MKVVLLAGGVSSEREVSLASGAAVFAALQRLGHEVYALDPADGRSLLDNNGKFIMSPPAHPAKEVAPAKTDVPALAQAFGKPPIADAEVVFIALHGGAGENGVIQCLLELAGVAYTGSDMTASAIAMNKAVTKRLLTSEKIPTPDWELYRLEEGTVDDELLQAICRRFSFPLIVKPNDSGSTVGLSKVAGESDLPAALEKALKESPNILVERYIPGRELTVAVLEGEALPVVEIKPKSGLYDYEAKYTKGKTEYIVPAQIEPAVAERLQAAAVKAYRVIGAAGLVRVDFILDNDSQFYCLEVNTIPGMTNLSLAPMAAQAAGIEFDELITRILEAALKAHHRRSGSKHDR